MSEESQTLNQEPDSSSAQTLNEAVVSSSPVAVSDELVSTVEFDEKPVAEKKPEAKSKDGEAAPKEKDAVDDGDEVEDERGPVPYSRFRAKVKQINELAEKFGATEKELSELKRQLQAKLDEPIRKESAQPKQPPAKLPFTHMGSKTPQELAQWFDEDPRGFLANLVAQTKYETKQEVLTEFNKHNQTMTFKQKIDEFSKENDGFNQMLNKGQLDEFCDSNPGHDIFSAYYELTKESRSKSIEQRINDAVAKAKEEVKQEYEKNMKAKRELKPIDGGASKPKPMTDKELEDTKKQGGLTNVLASRLMAMRQKAG